MSRKPVFEKIAKIQRLYYVPLRGHTIFVLSTPTLTVTVIDKITIFCNDVGLNKASTTVELLAINIYVTLS